MKRLDEGFVSVMMKKRNVCKLCLACERENAFCINHILK